MKNNKNKFIASICAAMMLSIPFQDAQAQDVQALPQLMEQMLDEANGRGQNFLDETNKSMLSIRPGLADASHAKDAVLRQAGD